MFTYSIESVPQRTLRTRLLSQIPGWSPVPGGPFKATELYASLRHFTWLLYLQPSWLFLKIMIKILFAWASPPCQNLARNFPWIGMIHGSLAGMWSLEQQAAVNTPWHGLCNVHRWFPTPGLGASLPRIICYFHFVRPRTWSECFLEVKEGKKTHWNVQGSRTPGSVWARSSASERKTTDFNNAQ